MHTSDAEIPLSPLPPDSEHSGPTCIGSGAGWTAGEDFSSHFYLVTLAIPTCFRLADSVTEAFWRSNHFQENVSYPKAFGITSTWLRAVVNMLEPEPKPQLQSVMEATVEDLDTLSTILARSFHNKNPYIRQCFPDTSMMRRWWSLAFSAGLRDLNTHILTIRDGKSSSISIRPPTIGVLVCRLMGAQETGKGFFEDATIRPDDDHDRDMYHNMIQTMVSHRERLMLGSRHFCIELFGVDEAYQGTGVGRCLLKHACRLADDAGLKTFVLANAGAKSFYERHGFLVDEVVTLPGELRYVEYLMVRSPQGSLLNADDDELVRQV
nr:hypothetical protein CFP56_32139 [Quercus suber]